jgi:acetolactate synthase I/II/III large subunit
LVLVGATPPVSIFGSPDQPSWLTPEGCDILYLAHEHEDGIAALEAVAEAVAAPAKPAGRARLALPNLPTGESLDPSTISRVVAYYLPENAIIADEAVSSGPSLQPLTATARPHDHLAVSGGSIGCALPMATGAAIACPGRKTICLHGDGGAMTTLQALWTPRENLDVTTVIFSNRSYAIIEMARAGFHSPGPRALSLFDLSRPSLDWVKVAAGMGVEATRAETVGAFADQFASAVRTTGPRLIEAVM